MRSGAVAGPLERGSLSETETRAPAAKFRPGAALAGVSYLCSAGRKELTLRTRSATFWAPMRSMTQAR
jgi:hypothetical protein